MNTLHIVLAVKPFDGTFASNVLICGTGALNIDGTRISTDDNLTGGAYAKAGTDRHDGYENWRFKRKGDAGEYQQPEGRFPANVILNNKVTKLLDRQSGIQKDGVAYEPNGKRLKRSVYQDTGTLGRECGYGGSGGVSRFFKTFEGED
jgi:site-specific DNA-methyltransferase (adenine-specific)